MNTRSRRGCFIGIFALPPLALALFGLGVAPARALEANLPPKDNFDLSHWKLQLPVNSAGVLSGANDSVDVSVSQLNNGLTNAYFNGFTNAYFYTGPDGAMVFWVPDNGAMTSGSTHPRSELREMLNPNDTGVNWTLYGTHILTATCVVSNVPSDTGKVCLGQMHEPNTKPDGSASAGNEHMIMFDLNNRKIYANVNLDGDLSSSFSTTIISGSGVALGSPINYTMSVVNGLLTIIVNNVTNSYDLFSGTNYNGHIAQNWDPSSGNTLYFKAGAYNQTTNQCHCSTDGAKVAFYGLSRYHAPSITNQPTSRAVSATSNTTFSVSALGNGTLTYQWWFNATNSLTRATSASLTLTNLSGANAGNYTVVVSDSLGAVTSAVASLMVTYPSTTVTFSTPGSANWTCPAGVTSLQVECWGGGGAGGSAYRTANGSAFAGGGAGGAYARLNSYTVTPGSNYTVTVGAGGDSSTTDLATVPGGDTWFSNATTILAKGGGGGVSIYNTTASGRAGAGGTGSSAGCIGDVKYAGGSGDAGQTSSGSPANIGGGGGGSAGNLGAGGDASGSTPGSAGNGGGAVGGGGAMGTSANGTNGIAPGGGGGGARSSSNGIQKTGGTGGAGQVVLTYANCTAPAAVTQAATSVTANGATLNGSVNPNGGAASCYFRYGTTTSYGSYSATNSLSAGTSPVGVNAVLTGLSPGTLYHYQVAANNSAGTGAGTDQFFTTATVSAPDLSGLTLTAGGSFQFAFSSTPGASFTVLVSTNLSDWAVLGPATEGPAGQYQAIDPQATNSPQRFYRVRSP